jgi:Tfp pilus assembly protein PilV
MRNGFSLVEALVALALFQIAMLALAATTMVAARDLGSAARRGRAFSIAASRMEQLRITACRESTSVAEQSETGGYREHWRIEGATPRALSDSVSFVLPTGREAYVVARAEMLCTP